MRPVFSAHPVDRGWRVLLLRGVLDSVCARHRCRAGAGCGRRGVRSRAAGRSCIGRGGRRGHGRGRGGRRGNNRRSRCGSCRFRRRFLAATDQDGGEGNSDEDRAFHVLPLRVDIVGVVRRRAECSEWVSAHAPRTTMGARRRPATRSRCRSTLRGMGSIVSLGATADFETARLPADACSVHSNRTAQCYHSRCAGMHTGCSSATG